MGLSTLFVYGTLRCPDIMKAVTGLTFAPKDAVLEGYRVLKVRNEAYPGMIPSPGDLAEGGVYFGLDADAFSRLDAFEGEMYARREVTVRTVGDQDVSALAYIVKAAFESSLENLPWRLDDFKGTAKDAFITSHLS